MVLKLTIEISEWGRRHSGKPLILDAEQFGYLDFSNRHVFISYFVVVLVFYSTEQMKVESMELLAHMDRAISSGEKLVSRMENLKKPAGNKTRLRKRDIERGLLEYLDALDRQLESYEDLISLTKNRSALGHDHCFRALKDARKSAKITRKLAGAGAIVATTLVGAGIGAVAGPLGILAVGFASGLTATLFAVIGGAFRPDLLDALEVSVKSATTVKASLKSIYG